MRMSRPDRPRRFHGYAPRTRVETRGLDRKGSLQASQPRNDNQTDKEGYRRMRGNRNDWSTVLGNHPRSTGRTQGPKTGWAPPGTSSAKAQTDVRSAVA